jgi:glyoxylase I family protein
MFKGLEHAAIASPDPEKLARWYVDHLGFTINYSSPATKTTFVKAPNGSMFEIIASEGERAPSAMKAPGLRHLAIASTRRTLR